MSNTPGSTFFFLTAYSGCWLRGEKKSPYFGTPTFGRNWPFQEGLSSNLEQELLKIFAAVGR